jgi:hypothetical protein
MKKNKMTDPEEAKGKKENSTNSRRQLWNFPKNNLEDTIKLIQQIEEKYAGKKTKAEDLEPLTK